MKWVIDSPISGTVEARVSYLTAGMRWDADYNFIAMDADANLDIAAWVTLSNDSGKPFLDADVELMADDSGKPPPSASRDQKRSSFNAARSYEGNRSMAMQSFQGFHLYPLARSISLREGESKQVELVRASGIPSEQVYIYDGGRSNENQYRGWNPDRIRREQDFGTESITDVGIFQSIDNTAENRLGLPLPFGRTRFYEKTEMGQLRFIAEGLIYHTPQNEPMLVYVGNAPGISGGRTQVAFAYDSNRKQVDEGFRIKLTNNVQETVEIRVFENLHRSSDWEIAETNAPWVKIGVQRIEFRVQIAPGEEKSINYNVHYSW